MKIWPLLLTSSILVSVALSAEGQVLFQAPVGITQSPSQISTFGSYVDAVGANGGGGSITVGSTTFNSIFSDAGITLSSPTNIGGGTDGSGTNATPFQSVLNGVAYVGDFNSAHLQTGTVTLHNLQVGNVYQVQVFSFGNFISKINGLNSEALFRDYTIGTFVATGIGLTTTQSFTFDSSLSGIGEINAISLRNITAEVPEPSTYAMMLAGLAFLCFCARRKRVSREF